MESNIVDVENLSLAIGKFNLSPMSFSIPKGSIVALIGNNGSGKSLLIKCLLNIYHPDSGVIRILGQDIIKAEKVVKKNIGCVFDDGFFFEQFSLQEMTAIISPGYTKWDSRVFDAYIAKFELDMEQTINQLSKGMKMKFALALALSHNADLLIMDEPTNGLDMVFREEILDIIKTEVIDKNRTAIFSTHLSSDIETIADYLLILDNGTLLFSDSKKTLLNLPVMKNNVSFKEGLLELLQKGRE